jgi:hypothetical protein
MAMLTSISGRDRETWATDRNMPENAVAIMGGPTIETARLLSQICYWPDRLVWNDPVLGRQYVTVSDAVRVWRGEA